MTSTPAVLTLAAALAAPSVAFACGGFFCNSADPVTQAGEQILFARDGDQLEMHVQIAYSGPPIEFGWLLPAPPDVETDVSSDALFQRLGQLFTPRFRLRTEYAPGCEEPPAPDYGALADAGFFAAADMSVAPPPGPQGVDVLSRESVGPYDRVILQADDVDNLLLWLDQNDFQAPFGAEERLEPYIESSVFVALKLLPGNDTDDIKPLRLRFTAPSPAVPIIPTAVAADPDMSLIIYLLGEGRAVPRNYLHLEVNEATITWEDGGRNYVDAVSHAVDEAGGQAFVTDFAGRTDGQVGRFDLDLDLDGIAQVRTVEDLFAFRNMLQSSEIRPFVRASITPPEGSTVDDVLRSPFAYDLTQIPCDGALLAANLQELVIPAWQRLDDLFAAHGDLTRLFTTMSPAEMEVDPIFDFNVDLPAVPAERWGVRTIECGDDDLPDHDQALITTADGTQYRLEDWSNPHAVVRQNGETVRGQGEVGAAVVQRPFAAGMFEVQTDNRPLIAELYGAGDPVDQDDPGLGRGGNGGDDGEDFEGSGRGPGGPYGCNCDVGEGGPGHLLWPVLLLAVGLGRRRARRA